MRIVHQATEIITMAEMAISLKVSTAMAVAKEKWSVWV
jgi:hypothetical protein